MRLLRTLQTRAFGISIIERSVGPHSWGSLDRRSMKLGTGATIGPTTAHAKLSAPPTNTPDQHPLSSSSMWTEPLRGLDWTWTQAEDLGPFVHTGTCASVVGVSVDPSVVGRDWSPVSSNKARGCCCRTPGDH
jgi:hypothetical protein